jgi:hypothetical protein
MPSSSDATSHPRRRRVATAAGLARLLPWYLAFGALRHLVPLPWLARWAWRASSRERDLEFEQKLVARVIRLRHTLERGRGDCLQSSLVLYRELSRAGADPTLVVGFRRTNGRMQGHAWVLTEGRPVGESQDALDGFAPTFGFGRHGTLQPTPEWASGESLRRI